ncbi:unnamed protein product [Arabidopsis halleri]
MWEHIRKRYRVPNGPRIQQLRKELANCQQVGLSIETYYGRLTKLWDSYNCYRPPLTCVCGNCTCDLSGKSERQREEDKVHDFLMGLDEDTFGIVKSNLMSQEPLPTLEFVYLKQTSRPRFRPDDRDLNVVCSNCRRTGHRAEGCFQLLGYPEWWGDRPRDRVGRGRGSPSSTGSTRGRGGAARVNVARAVEQTEVGVANAAITDSDRSTVIGLTDEQWLSVKRVMSAATVDASEQMSGNISSISWILDTGATHHLTCKKGILRNVRKSTPTQIMLADGRIVVSKTVGTVVLNSHLSLVEVFYIENFGFDLISVTHLMEENDCVMQLSVPFCVLQDRTTRMLIGVEDTFPYLKNSDAETELGELPLASSNDTTEETETRQTEPVMQAAGPAMTPLDSNDVNANENSVSVEDLTSETESDNVDEDDNVVENEAEAELNDAPIALRKGVRERNAPGYLADYDTTLVCATSTSLYPIAAVLSSELCSTQIISVDRRIAFGQLRRYAWRELQLATDEFSQKNVLGQGGFGKVYKELLPDGT